MFCVHCGSSFQEEGQFCPQCGRAIASQTRLKWRYWPFVLSLVVFSIFTLLGWQIYDQFRSDLSRVLSSQLDAIRNNEITRAYYEFSSDEFKRKMPLLSFKELVRSRPAFSQNRTFHTKKMEIHGKKGTLIAELVASQDEKEEVSFQFIKEKEKWKVGKIRLKDASFLVDEEDEQEMRQLVEGQLSTLKAKDIVDAYYQYTSKDFQRFTPLSTFQEFTDFFSVMQHFKTVQFHHLTCDDDLTQWDVALQGDKGETQVSYIFCKEEGIWKILGIQFSDFFNEVEHHPIEIVQAQLQAIRNHEMAKAYFEFTSKEFRNKMSLKEFKIFLTMQESFYHNREAQVNLTLEEENSVTISALLKSMGLQVLKVEYELVLEDDMWKIDQIQLRV